MTTINLFVNIWGTGMSKYKLTTTDSGVKIMIHFKDHDWELDLTTQEAAALAQELNQSTAAQKLILPSVPNNGLSVPVGANVAYD